MAEVTITDDFELTISLPVSTSVRVEPQADWRTWICKQAPERPIISVQGSNNLHEMLGSLVVHIISHHHARVKVEGRAINGKVNLIEISLISKGSK